MKKKGRGFQNRWTPQKMALREGQLSKSNYRQPDGTIYDRKGKRLKLPHLGCVLRRTTAIPLVERCKEGYQSSQRHLERSSVNQKRSTRKVTEYASTTKVHYLKASHFGGKYGNILNWMEN